MTEDVPEFELSDDDEVATLLRAAQGAMLRHPAAAQAMLRALAAEGRAFARTPEGAALRERVARSDLVRRGRVVWEVATLNALEEHGETLLPSKVLDAMAKATRARDLEPMLTRLFGLEADGDDAAAATRG